MKVVKLFICIITIFFSKEILAQSNLENRGFLINKVYEILSKNMPDEEKEKHLKMELSSCLSNKEFSYCTLQEAFVHSLTKHNFSYLKSSLSETIFNSLKNQLTPKKYMLLHEEVLDCENNQALQRKFSEITIKRLKDALNLKHKYGRNSFISNHAYKNFPIDEFIIYVKSNKKQFPKTSLKLLESYISLLKESFENPKYYHKISLETFNSLIDLIPLVSDSSKEKGKFLITEMELIKFYASRDGKGSRSHSWKKYSNYTKERVSKNYPEVWDVLVNGIIEFEQKNYMHYGCYETFNLFNNTNWKNLNYRVSEEEWLDIKNSDSRIENYGKEKSEDLKLAASFSMAVEYYMNKFTKQNALLNIDTMFKIDYIELNKYCSCSISLFGKRKGSIYSEKIQFNLVDIMTDAHLDENKLRIRDENELFLPNSLNMRSDKLDLIFFKKETEEKLTPLNRERLKWIHASIELLASICNNSINEDIESYKKKVDFILREADAEFTNDYQKYLSRLRSNKLDYERKKKLNDQMKKFLTNAASATAKDYLADSFGDELGEILFNIYPRPFEYELEPEFKIAQDLFELFFLKR